MENGKPKTVNGILLVDKPAGWTSHDVVAKIRRILATEARSENRESRIIPNSQFPIRNSARPKVGHTGTLDPAATGLLILVLGSYTKRAAEFSKLDKTYKAELTLGKVSSTGDSEGELTGYSGQVTGYSKKPTREEVEVVLSQFKGKIQQTPHRYSAVKVGGKRAYKEARAGREVKLEPREVEVYGIQLTAYSYPKLSIVTEVSSGTYIRSLAEDIGQKLGTGAYLSALRRTAIGKFRIKDAIGPEKIDLEKLSLMLRR